MDLPHVTVQLLLFEVKHIELNELPPQVLIQLCVHADSVGLGVTEMWLAAAVDGGGGVVGELEELEDHVRARLLRPPGFQISASFHSDVEFVPPAAGHLLQRKQRVNIDVTGRLDATTWLQSECLFCYLCVLAQTRVNVVGCLDLLSIQMHCFSHGKLQSEPVLQGTEGRNLIGRA